MRKEKFIEKISAFVISNNLNVAKDRLQAYLSVVYTKQNWLTDELLDQVLEHTARNFGFVPRLPNDSDFLAIKDKEIGQRKKHIEFDFARRLSQKLQFPAYEEDFNKAENNIISLMGGISYLLNRATDQYGQPDSKEIKWIVKEAKELFNDFPADLEPRTKTGRITSFADGIKSLLYRQNQSQATETEKVKKLQGKIKNINKEGL